MHKAVVLIVLALVACHPVVSTVPEEVVPTDTAQTVTQPTRTISPEPIATVGNVVYVTAFEALHVRAEPDHEAKILDYLYVGEDVTLTGKCSDGWAQIEWKGSTAWVNAKFLSENKCSEEQ